MVSCKIELENNQRAVYYAGQLLKGGFLLSSSYQRC